jgi:hypothetical protein
MMIKEIGIPREDSKIKGFPYQLTDWVPTREDLEFAEETFIKYKEEYRAVVAKSPAGYAMFTDGGSRMSLDNKSYRTEEKPKEGSDVKKRS